MLGNLFDRNWLESLYLLKSFFFEHLLQLLFPYRAFLFLISSIETKWNRNSNIELLGVVVLQTFSYFSKFIMLSRYLPSFQLFFKLFIAASRGLLSSLFKFLSSGLLLSFDDSDLSL